MEAHPAVAGAHASSSEGSVSVPRLVGAAVLAGVGLLGTIYWLITFRWLYFLSLGLLAGGAYLLFTRASGADHA